jgi:hypothetical protein
MGKYLSVLLSVLITTSAVIARPGGDWSQVDPEIREWMSKVHRPDIGTGHDSSCCGIGDSYEADLGKVLDDGMIVAIVTNNRGNFLPVGTELIIDPRKIQNTEGNPTGHVIVFASEYGVVYCFIPNGSG